MRVGEAGPADARRSGTCQFALRTCRACLRRAALLRSAGRREERGCCARRCAPRDSFREDAAPRTHTRTDTHARSRSSHRLSALWSGSLHAQRACVLAFSQVTLLAARCCCRCRCVGSCRRLERGTTRTRQRARREGILKEEGKQRARYTAAQPHTTAHTHTYARACVREEESSRRRPENDTAPAAWCAWCVRAYVAARPLQAVRSARAHTHTGSKRRAGAQEGRREAGRAPGPIVQVECEIFQCAAPIQALAGVEVGARTCACMHARNRFGWCRPNRSRTAALDPRNRPHARAKPRGLGRDACMRARARVSRCPIPPPLLTSLRAHVRAPMMIRARARACMQSLIITHTTN